MRRKLRPHDLADDRDFGVELFLPAAGDLDKALVGRIADEVLACPAPGARGPFRAEPGEVQFERLASLRLGKRYGMAEFHALGVQRRRGEGGRVPRLYALLDLRVEKVQRLDREFVRLRDLEAEARKTGETRLDEPPEGDECRLQFFGKVDVDVLDVPLVDVGPDILVGLHPGLDRRDMEVCTDLLHLQPVPPGGCGHREQQGLACRRAVVPGKEDVGVVSHRPVALVHDQQDDVGEAVPAGQAVVLDHLRRGKTDPARLPGFRPPVGGRIPGEHGKVGLFRLGSLPEEEKPFEKTEVLLDQGFCGCKHEHLSRVGVETGCRDEERDGRLPEARREDDHRVRVKRPEGDGELVSPLFDALRPDQRVGDRGHTLSSRNAAAPEMSAERTSGSRSTGTRTCSMLSRSLTVTVLSSSVS